MGASVLLPRLISPQKAFDYLLTGSTVSGGTAQQHGLILEAVDKVHLLSPLSLLLTAHSLTLFPRQSEVVPRAIQFAESITENAPIAVQSLVKSLRADKFAGLDDGLLREANAQAAAYASNDLLVGLHAIRNKISPKFTGW